MKRFTQMALFGALIVLNHEAQYAFSGQAKAQTPIILWIMPNEPAAPLNALPGTEHEIKAYLQDNGILNSVQELTDDVLFSRLVWGQKKILDEIRRYRTEHGGADIHIRFIKWIDAFNLMKSAARAEDVPEIPDIIQIGTTWTPHFAETGYIADLSKDFDQNLYAPAAVANCKIYGSETLYAVPWFVDMRVLAYWKKAVENPAVDLADWEHFAKTCEQIQARIAGGDKNFADMKNAFALSTIREWDLLHRLSLWIWSYGGDILQQVYWIRNKAVFNQSAALEGIRNLHRLAQSGCTDLPEIEPIPLLERFKQGVYAMMINGPWIIKELEEYFERGDIGFAPIPSGPAGRFAFVGGSNLAILTRAKKHQTFYKALDLIKHLTSSESQMRYVRATGNLPASQAALDTLLASDAIYKTFGEALQYGRHYLRVPEFAPVVEVDNTLDNIFLTWKAIAYGESFGRVTNLLDTAVNDINDRLDIFRNFYFWLVVAISIFALLALVIYYFYLRFTFEFQPSLAPNPLWPINISHYYAGYCPITNFSVTAKSKKTVFNSTMRLAIPLIGTLWEKSHTFSKVENSFVQNNFAGLLNLELKSFAALHNRFKGVLMLSVSTYWVKNCRENYTVDIHPVNYWCPEIFQDNGEDLLRYESLACLVFPTSEAIEWLVGHALDCFRLFTNNPDDTFDGYPENGDTKRVELMLKAIYTALLFNLGITYRFEKEYDVAAVAQSLRFPDEVRRKNWGTCIDLALFMAACLENIGLHPMVILSKRSDEKVHAFVGCWKDGSLLAAQAPPRSVIADFDTLRQYHEHLFWLEPVSFTKRGSRDPKTFEHCLHDGNERYNEIITKGWELWHAVDIAAARENGISPLPLSPSNWLGQLMAIFARPFLALLRISYGRK